MKNSEQLSNGVLAALAKYIFLAATVATFITFGAMVVLPFL